SLGSVIYAMCVAHPPFRAETSYGILRKITDQSERGLRQQNAEVPEWLERMTTWLLAKDPSDRPESANEVAAMLEACLAHLQQPTVAKLPVPLRDTSRQHGSVKAIGLVLALVALILVTFAIWSPGRDDTAASKSQNQAPPVSPPASSVSVDDLFADDKWELEIDAIESEIKRIQIDIEIQDPIAPQ
ncbi:MAG: hypothetical protein AAGA03_20145, partial [Planctomycetota bacterium]